MKFRFILLLIIFAFAVVVAMPQDTTPVAVNTVNIQDTRSDAAFGRGYTLGPGDQVAGGLLGELGYDFVATVDENGMLEIPFMPAPVPAQCRTERELRTELETEIKKYFRDPHFSFRIVEKHSRPPVTVSGEVTKQTAEITLTRRATLREILSLAGGPKDEASGEIVVSRLKTPMCMAENDADNWKTGSNSRTYSYASIQLGKEDSNPTIYPGDVIVVKRASPVYINGEVVGGQGIYIKENGLSLAGAIGMVGGSKPGADIKNIAIYRLKPGSSPESQDRDLISANLKLIRSGKQKDIMLQPYDLIVIDKAKKPIGAIIAEVALNAGKTLVSGVANATPYRIIY